MSFFGFDTTLPRDRSAGAPPDGNGSSALLGGLDDDALDAKIRGLAAGAQEDVEIYTWGGEDYDGLGDMLDEAGDDFNDDTFGAGPVGKDFDFGGPPATTSKAGNDFGASQQQQQRKGNDAAFKATLDDIWSMPDFKSSRPGLGGAQQAASPGPFGQPASQAAQQLATPATRPSAAPRSLEEIEAGLRASAQQQQSPAPAPAQPPAGKRPLTLEEVEAEMLKQRQAAVPQQPQQPFPPQPQAQQQQQQPPAPPSAPLDAFPPLGSQPPPPQGPAAMGQLLPPGPPGPINSQLAQQQHFARMRSLLEALPDNLRAGVLALPPHSQFDAVEGLSREFPMLVWRAEGHPKAQPDGRPWPRLDGSDEDRAVLFYALQAAESRLADMHKVEMRRARRAGKIASMARYNNLMSISDKDFITRIQVSQLITSDPYTDDFYAHIFFALRGGRPGPLGAQPPTAPRAILAGTGNEGGDSKKAGAATGNKKRQQQQQQQKLSRYENAMLRMQQQVERIVQNRKERLEKTSNGIALEGALGKISATSAKMPRQTLQVESGSKIKAGESEAGADGEEVKGDLTGQASAQNAVRQALKGASLGAAQATADGDDGTRQPLGKHEALRILERLYDVVLALEQSRRNAPRGAVDQTGTAGGAAAEAADVDDEGKAAIAAWQSQQSDLVSTLWSEWRVLEPLEISDPHPFVSLLSTVKGMRLLPRTLRHLSVEQTLTTMTMIVASFDTLTVVRQAALLDLPRGEVERNDQLREAAYEVARQTETFASSVTPAMLSLMAGAEMRIVTGMLALFVERNDLVRVARTKPGIAFLTIFLSRAETLKQGGTGLGNATKPTPEELGQFKDIFGLLFSRLTYGGQLPTLFPSTRAKAALPFGPGYYISSAMEQRGSRELDAEDEPVWNLMAALAVSASMEQQQILVQELRERILENVLSAKQWAAANPQAAESQGGSAADIRIRNVNLLLHALNLDATQITV